MTQEQAWRSFLQGERLYLREVRVSDANDAYYRWMNDPDVTRYLESRFGPNSIESIQEYVKAHLSDRSTLFLAIILNDGDRHIGNIKLGPIDWIHRRAELGLLLGEKDAWGHGYGSEAIDLLTRYAFDVLNLHKVTAGCYAPNIGSVKAFLKAGYEQEGIRKNHFYADGRFVDFILLGRCRSG